MAYFTTKDNCKIYYEEHGSGEPLIFIHGWSCNHKFFKYQVDEFAKKYRVILYDFRGHGQSDRSSLTERGMNLNRFAADLHELIEHLELKEVNVVGWSMGTSTLLAYAREFKCQYIKKMCFIDMTPKLLNDDEWKLGQSCTFDMDQNLQFMAALAVSWEFAAKLFIPNVFAKGYDQEKDEFKWVFNEALDNTPHCMLNMWIAMAIEDFRNVLPTIKVPVLLSYSGDGLLYTPAHGEYMRENLGGDSKLVIFPGCGHGLFLEDPEKFNSELAQFLEEGC